MLERNRLSHQTPVIRDSRLAYGGRVRFGFQFARELHERRTQKVMVSKVCKSKTKEIFFWGRTTVIPDATANNTFLLRALVSNKLHLRRHQP